MHSISELTVCRIDVTNLLNHCIFTSNISLQCQHCLDFQLYPFDFECYNYFNVMQVSGSPFRHNNDVYYPHKYAIATLFIVYATDHGDFNGLNL